ncbi:GNAT family N-acetyltransferase [Inquilinus limosus]|uniref:GNAT family N-acetyltransferase n=1 Tax=Inquilinus limosus TaxID=171674 RepID=UPI000407E571|nr:GNAT family N-acetyltransferase [Inquilinus limosus]
MSIAAELLAEEPALAALEPEWWELWSRCPAATPFQSPAWLLPWWRCFAPGRLRAIAVRRDGRLVGLAPLYLEDGALGRRLLLLGLGTTDYLDVLIDPDHTAPAAAAIAAAARDIDWEAWGLEELPPGAAALRLPCPCDCSETETGHSACPTLDLAGPDDLSGCVPTRRRKQLRRALTLAAKRGATEIEPVAGAADGFLDDLFRLHGARWADQDQPGLLRDAAVRRFHHEALPGLIRSGLARLYRLRIGGRVVGAFHGLSARGRTYAYLGGFDPDCAYESPGAILIGHAVAAAIREGGREFHFLRGREAYKYAWGAADRWNRRRSFRRAPA